MQPPPAPKPKLFSAGQNDVGSVSLPKFTSDTGGVIALVMANMAWSVIRTYLQNPASGVLNPESIQTYVKIVAGTWVVGLGVIIVHEFDPHLALLFAVLILVGNVLSNNRGNILVINAFEKLFSTGPTSS